MKKIIFLILSLMIMSSTVTQVFSSSTVVFTQQEKDFIAEHPIIYLGIDPTFIPFEFIDTDKSYNGIAKDYLDLISQKTGLTFKVTPNLTWDQAYEKGVLKELDVLPCIGISAEREKYFLFSEPYYSFKRVMFFSDTTNIKTFSELSGYAVAVQKNSSNHEFLKAYPLIKLHLYNTVEEALKALDDGTEDVFIGNLVSTLYLSKKAGYTQLQYADIPNQSKQSLYLAVRNDYPILVSILNKGLAAITKSEKIAIDNRWVGVIQTKDYSWLIQLVSIMVMLGLVIVLVSLYWIMRLKNEIDHRKVVELNLKYAKEEADKANQIKSRFLARMSHEIRTPLNAVTGMSYILKKTGLTMTQQSYLDKISAASKDVLEIINDILDFSKIEAGKVTLEKISFNLDEVLEHLISIISFKVEEQGIDLKIERDPLLPLYFLGDPKRIQQVLLNILNNSVKFTEKGTVTLKVKLNQKINDTIQLEFSVEDTGIGMTQEQLSGLFTPFTQADTSITRRFGGTGLGLSIVKSLLDLMDGTIEVNSVLSEGSVFRIKLNLAEDKVRNDEVRQLASELYLGDIKTLVLDKRNVHAIMIQDYLKAFNLMTDIFTDPILAKQAIESAFLSDHPYNLLILDHDTPDEKGIAFCQDLIKSPWIQETLKIILMIPFNAEDTFEKLDQAGVGFGISKPIIPSVLFNGIIDLFRHDVAQKLQFETSLDHTKSFEVDYPYSILLCEDNKTNQFIARSVLEQAGYKVMITENGQIGVDEFRNHPNQYDIILMDLHMPVKNGYEASAELRTMSADIPIIAMTADAITGIEQKCLDVGITHYITKPFDPGTLARTVFDLIQKNKGKNPQIEESVNSKVIEPTNALDQVAGMRNVGGNKALYQKILKIFFDENQNTSEELRIAITNKDFANAVQIVHKIKGSCGTIGASALYKNTMILQKALQNKNTERIAILHPEFTVLLESLLEEITALGL